MSLNWANSKEAEQIQDWIFDSNAVQWLNVDNIVESFDSIIQIVVDNLDEFGRDQLNDNESISVEKEMGMKRLKLILWKMKMKM